MRPVRGVQGLGMAVGLMPLDKVVYWRNTMSDIAEELRAQANQHPLDADLTMFDVAASRIEELESIWADNVRRLEIVEELEEENRQLRNAYKDLTGNNWS